MKKVVFRVDASAVIGTGHVMRCLSLADALFAQGKQVVFVCRSFPEDMSEYIRNKGYPVQILAANKQIPNTEQEDIRQIRGWLQQQEELIDWIVIDHYKIDAELEKHFRSHTKRIMVIDDLANRKHDCDILLDQNYYFCMENRYAGLLPLSCRQLLGPEYSLLRQEFILAKRQLKRRSGIVKRLLVFFGGSDPTGETVKTLKVLNALGRTDIITDVIVGQSNLQREQIRATCRQFGYNYYCQVENMAQFMTSADLSIGAGGSATWERCLLGLPTLVIEVAENQQEVTAAVAATGAIINMGRAAQVTESDLAKVLQNCLAQPEQLRRMSENALQLMGNSLHSGISKVLEVMEEVYAGT